MSDIHVLVTGGAGGIGSGIARVFAREGASVTLVDYREDALRREVAALERAFPEGQHAYVVADLTTGDDPGRAVRDAWERRPIDVLVNSAGLYPSTPFLSLTADIWDAVLDVNLRAAALTTVVFANAAIAEDRPGNVVNITSGAALRARTGAAPYSTSKAALEMLTKASALELGGSSIRVNAVSPGFVGVESPVNPYEAEYRSAADRNPLGVEGEPEDIGEAVFWLASDAARWVTGAIIRVDGGSSTGNTGLPRSWSTMSLGIKGEIPHE